MALTNQMKKDLLNRMAGSLELCALYAGEPLPDNSNMIFTPKDPSMTLAGDSDEYLLNDIVVDFEAGNDPVTATHIAFLDFEGNPGWSSPIRDQDGNPRTIELQPHDKVTFGKGSIVVRLSEIGRQILD